MFDKDAIELLQQGSAIHQASTAVEEAIEVTGAVALPAGYTIRDVEDFQDHRRRARGTMHTKSIAAFSDYARAHAEQGATVFVDTGDLRATAVLNLGTPTVPGHADNQAALTFQGTAAYCALQHINGSRRSQRDVAEFLEDWIDRIKAYDADGEVPPRKAIAAVRSIDIEAIRQSGSEEQSLSTTRSALETIRASSKHSLPDRIDFECQPHAELQSRIFTLRLSISTADDTPRIVLRIAREEALQEAIARELAEKIRAALPGDDDPRVLLGSYERGK